MLRPEYFTRDLWVVATVNPNLGGLFKGLFRGVVGGGGKITPYLKLVIIMLETWNLVHKYTHKFNIADVSIFVQKMSVFWQK